MYGVGLDEKTTKSTGNSISELLNIESCGGGGFLRTAAVLTSIQVGRVPVPPVMLGVRLLVAAVVLLRLMQASLCPWLVLAFAPIRGREGAS